MNQNNINGGFNNRSLNNRIMRIRAFPTAVEDGFITSLWDNLKQSIQEIQRKNNSGLSFEELYRNAYTMVLHKHADKLYNGLRDLIILHLQDAIRQTTLDAINGRFLEVLNKMWNEHTTAMVMIRDILMYMDRIYVQNTTIPSVYDLGLELFRDEIISFPVINEHLKATLLNMIALERQKEVIEWLDLKNVCQMLIILGLNNNRTYYEIQFETLFLDETSEFYRRASQRFLEDNSADVYIQRVNQCYIDEQERAQRYLDPITQDRIIRVLNEELVSKNMQTILEMENSGLKVMLADERIESMRMMYELFRRIEGGTKQMMDTMSKYLRDRGNKIVEEAFGGNGARAVNRNNEDVDEQPGTSEGTAVNQPKPVEFVKNTINLKDQFDRYLTQAFHNDREFEQRIQSDFSFFLNLDNKSAEYISRYIDEKIRKGAKVHSEVEVDEALEKALILFKFLQDKDLFEGFYKQHLAKRLLLERTVSEDIEKLMISKLKTECGTQFTARLEGMFRDIDLSNQTMNDYREHYDQASRPDIDITVRVLSQLNWPISHVPTECIIPFAPDSSFQHFKSLYLSKYSGRKLQINPALGSADVKVTFFRSTVEKKTSPDGQQEAAQPENSANLTSKRVRPETKILTVSTYMMIILLRFNHQERITFEQVLNETQIPEKDAKRALIALSSGKQIILNRVGNSDDIEKTDEFSVNDQFQSKLARIKITYVAARPDVEPERETRAKVEDDRKHEIEAAIVRVLKARKKITHIDLITEVTNQLKHRFMPDPMLIKKRIESLIEREYLERDKYNQKQYNYVA